MARLQIVLLACLLFANFAASTMLASGLSQTPASTVVTDWAVVSVSIQPHSPTVGERVTPMMVMTAVSSTGGFPQRVEVECIIDHSSCGAGVVYYLGPKGSPYTVTGLAWTATAGTHKLTWLISTANDPNPNNNVGTLTFQVA